MHRTERTAKGKLKSALLLPMIELGSVGIANSEVVACVWLRARVIRSVGLITRTGSIAGGYTEVGSVRLRRNNSPSFELEICCILSEIEQK